MKTIGLLCFALLAMALLSGPVYAGESSVEYGKKLFNDPTLGGSTNDKSCSTCHSNGKGLEHAGSKKNLTAMINHCITGPLGGKKIDGRSVEMRSLKMYIQTFEK